MSIVYCDNENRVQVDYRKTTAGDPERILTWVDGCRERRILCGYVVEWFMLDDDGRTVVIPAGVGVIEPFEPAETNRFTLS